MPGEVLDQLVSLIVAEFGVWHRQDLTQRVQDMRRGLLDGVALELAQ